MTFILKLFPNQNKVFFLVKGNFILSLAQSSDGVTPFSPNLQEINEKILSVPLSKNNLEFNHISLAQLLCI